MIPVTGFPLKSVIPTDCIVSVTGFPLASRVIFCYFPKKTIFFIKVKLFIYL